MNEQPEALRGAERNRMHNVSIYNTFSKQRR